MLASRTIRDARSLLSCWLAILRGRLDASRLAFVLIEITEMRGLDTLRPFGALDHLGREIPDLRQPYSLVVQHIASMLGALTGASPHPSPIPFYRGGNTC